MIRKISIPKQYVLDTLLNSGYARHRKSDHGFIKEIPGDRRFHAYIIDDYIELHIDNIKGRHKVLYDKIALNYEKGKILGHYRRLNPQKMSLKPEYAPNLREIQKRKVLSRKWYNPMRYIKGKLKYYYEHPHS